MSEPYLKNPVPSHIKILPNGKPDYPLTRNLKMPPEAMGLEIPSVPFGDKSSSQRMNMYANNTAQALITRGAEFPQISSGFEKEYLKYTFNATRFEENAVILKWIPKYRTGVGDQHINHCPTGLLVYLGDDDKKVHSMWVSNYTKGTNGFGWENYIDQKYFSPGHYVEKGETVSHSNAVKGDRYCQGINANVCYGTWPGTVEDAIVISDEFARKAISIGYREMIIDIGPNLVPLNLYGEIGEYKFMPDIGERVNPDGIVCAFRKVDPVTYFADMTELALMQVQPLHDDVYYQTDPGAIVVDIEVFKNENRRVLTQDAIFRQLTKYEQEARYFQEQVIKTYEEECVAKGRLPHHTFNTVVRDTARYLTTVKKSVLGSSRKSLAKFRRKDMPIQYIQLRVVLKYEIRPNRGSKMCGQFGDKGVVSEIVPKEHMPVNDHGVVADMLVSPMSVPNRMNPGQLYQTFTSEMCRLVFEKMVAAGKDTELAFQHVIDFYNDVDPGVAEIAQRIFATPALRAQFVRDTLNEGYLYVVSIPFSKFPTTEWVLRMAKKYNIRQTPVEFNQLDRNGNVVRRIRTKRNMFIGKKYILVLCKVPFCKSSGLSYVNSLGVPITVKDSNTKAQTAVAPTSVRFGEDETRIAITSLGPDMVVRFLGINANAPNMTVKLALALATEMHPSKLTFIPHTNEEIILSSKTIASLHAMANVTGIELDGSIASKEEMDEYYSDSVPGAIIDREYEGSEVDLVTAAETMLEEDANADNN